MNAILAAFQNAQRNPGKSFDVRYGIYRLSFRDTDLEAFKPNGEGFSDDEVKEVQAEIVNLTQRRWARFTKHNEDHHARFALIPVIREIKGSSVSPEEPIFPAPNGVSVAVIACRHRAYDDCQVELLTEGLHFGSPVKYGHCLDCGRCFVSIQR